MTEYWTSNRIFTGTLPMRIMPVLPGPIGNSK